MANKKNKTPKATNNVAMATSGEQNAALKEAFEKFIGDQSQVNMEALNKAILESKLVVPFKIEALKTKFGTVRRSAFLLRGAPDGKHAIIAFVDENAVNIPDPTVKKERLTLSDIDERIAKMDSVAGMFLAYKNGSLFMPKEGMGRLTGRIKPPAVPTSYGEPAVYPTRMVTAVYDVCETNGEISRVWLKQKNAGGQVSHFFMVEADKDDSSLLDILREAALPYAKDVPVEVVFVNKELLEKVIKESYPLFDRELDL